MAVNKNEHNFVADSQNWEQRIRTELDSSIVWQNNWGELFAKDQPATYDEKIKAIEKRLHSMPKNPMETNNRTYGIGEPFHEISERVHNRKKINLNSTIYDHLQSTSSNNTNSTLSSFQGTKK